MIARNEQLLAYITHHEAISRGTTPKIL